MTLTHGLADFAASAHTAPPSRLGTRYDSTRFLPEAGNTVVCHLDFGAPGHEPVLEARARMQALPGAGNFLFTPVPSLHMTVFEGALETRRSPDAWPAWAALDAPIRKVTEAQLPRLEGFRAPPPFSVKVVDLKPTGLQLAGASDADETALRQWREALTAPFGYRHADHDAYVFHMSFAYPLAWLPDDLLEHWQQACDAILADLRQAAPVIPLTRPAFCRFPDMTLFEELLVL